MYDCTASTPTAPPTKRGPKIASKSGRGATGRCASAMLGRSLDEVPAAGPLTHSRRPEETPPRQKRRPNTSSGARRPQARPSPSPAARTEASHMPSTLQRHVSFAQVRPRSAHAPLTRHHSFEPRVGRRDGGSHHHGSHRGGSPHRPSSAAGSTGSHSSRRGGGGSSETAWEKLVVRTQTLEEDLAGERASKRLLATRMLQSTGSAGSARTIRGGAQGPPGAVEAHQRGEGQGGSRCSIARGAVAGRARRPLQRARAPAAPRRRAPRDCCRRAPPPPPPALALRPPRTTRLHRALRRAFTPSRRRQLGPPSCDEP